MSEELIVKKEIKMKTSEAIGNIAKALSQLQLEITNPANTAVNPFYKSKYAPLPDVLNIVRPLAGKYGLAIIQNTYNDDDRVFITTLVVHESGEWIETSPLVLKPEKNTPQGVGSAITYGRRYQLSAVIGIASEEDDDGNSNENSKSAQKGKKEEPPKTEKNEFDTIKKQIMEKAREKSAISDDIKTQVKDILAKYHASGNPNKIETIEQAKKCLEEINNIKMEDNK